MPDITQMFAFVAPDSDEGGDGIVALNFDGMWRPLVGGDLSLIPKLMPLAQELADSTGKTFEVRVFSAPQVYTTVHPS